ncbi:MAG: hypothetical protein LBQ46_01495 [Treponema sp.]|jgi:transglutaminase-like putative cysteine protease|nr:hypothetical protein [Treponema sp.]
MVRKIFRKFFLPFVLCGLAVSCETVQELPDSASGPPSNTANANTANPVRVSAKPEPPKRDDPDAANWDIEALTPPENNNAQAKTDEELINDAINLGNCMALYTYIENNARSRLAVSAANTLRRYTSLDNGIAKYRTGRMDSKIRRVPKELAERVFTEPGAALSGLVSFLTGGISDQFLKAKILHDWICDNIAYDTEMYFSGRTANQDYESVLKIQRAVCSGYTNLYNEMCKLAGITSIGIEGYSKGFGYTGTIGKNTDHAWNAIKLGNKWYLIDVTWDAGSVDKRTFIKRYSTDWLFLDSRPFLYSHLPANDHYQFYAPALSAEDFIREPYIRGKFFQYGLTIKSDFLQYHNLTEGDFSIDIAVPNSNVSLSSELRTPERDIDAASWADRRGTTATIVFDVPDSNGYKGHIFAGLQNEIRPQNKIDIPTFEGDWLPRTENLLAEKKITEREFALFTDSYIKISDNNSYYFLEDQFDTARNNAVLKIHRLLELSTGWMEDVLNFNLKAAPGYRGFGTGVLKYPYTFTPYNSVSNTKLVSPIKGVLTGGTTETFSMTSQNYTRIAIIINGNFHQLVKNSRTGVFELTFEIPSGLTELTLYGSKDGRNYTGLIRYNIEQ